jgi:hypothetical protein
VEKGDSYIPSYKRPAEECWVFNMEEYHGKYLKAVYKRGERLRNRNIYIAAIRFLADKLYNIRNRKPCIGYL